MKNDLQAGLQNIIDAINNLIEPKLGSLRYDKTFRAKVISDEGNNVYGVQINGKNYKAVYTGGKIPVGQIVKVKAPLNNFSDIYIETLPGSGSGSAGNYNDLLNKPILNTNNTGTQVPSATETIQGTISLHKVSKTGNYNDLLNKPTLDFIPTSEKGAANGVAGLDENKRVSKGNLPTDTVYDNNYVHTDNNFTTAMKNKLDSVEEGAEPNKIEIIQRNGSVLPINNKTVNVEVPTKTSDLTNDSGFISSIPVASDTILGGIKVGENLSITADGVLSAEGGGTTDYSVLLNKPVLNTANTKSLTIDSNETINGIVSLHKISKTGSYEDLLNKPTIPTKTSDLTNDSNFITNTVNDLTNYYLKSETYTQSEVNNLIGQIKTISIEVVDTLPTTGEDNKIYLVPKEGSTGDVYNEYIWVNNAWELIGSTQVDLTGYATQDWVNNQIKNFLTESQVTEIVNNSLTNYYTKTETYSKTEVNNLLDNKADTSNIPTKTGDLTNNGDGTTGSKYITNSNFNTELEGKQDKITGGATTIVTDDLTVNRALVSNANGKVAVSNTTSTELGYLSGARSNLQNQIDTITTSGGQPNVIEVVQENGVPLEIINKTVNVTVPTKVSELENDKSYLTEIPIASTTVLGGIKIGENLSITDDGILSAQAGTTIKNLLDGIASGSLRGIKTFKEGNYGYYLGESALAEGYNTEASGNYSHAEGYNSLAGRKAFKIISGDSTTKTYTLNSIQDISIGDSFGTQCYNMVSFSTGTVTAIDETNKVITVSKFDSLSDKDNYLFLVDKPRVGDYHISLASACAHAEGNNTIAAGNLSHAEGYGTTAIGFSSHAEGANTIAKNVYQHVQGKFNISDTTSLDIIGNGTNDTNRSNAYTLDANGNGWFSGEVYVGSTSGTNKDSGSKKLITLDEIPIASSETLGLIKVGDNLIISDDGTLSAQAGTTIKNLVDGSGEGALKQINATRASGENSFAEGNRTTASGDYSHAEGQYSTATNTYSHAEGYNSQATGIASHAEGNSTIASGARSHAEGSNTKATSQSSHAEGVSTLAGRNAFTVVSGDSTAKTYTLDSIKGLSIDMKYSIKSESSPQYLNQGTITAIDTDTNTITVSYYRDIEGDNKYLYIYDRPDIGTILFSDISSGFSHVEGQNTVATHYQSHAEGLGTIANGDNQHVQGKYNISDDTSLDIIGNGTSADARSNAYTLDASGNAWYSGDIYVGSTSGTNKDSGSVKLAKITDIVTSYNDLTDKPTIPTKTSDLTNDSGYLEFELVEEW